MLIDNEDGTMGYETDESKGWISVGIFLTGVFIGICIASFSVMLYDFDYFKVSVTQTKQEIFSLPNGTTWKKIRTAEEVK